MVWYPVAQEGLCWQAQCMVCHPLESFEDAGPGFGAAPYPTFASGGRHGGKCEGRDTPVHRNAPSDCRLTSKPAYFSASWRSGGGLCASSCRVVEIEIQSSMAMVSCRGSCASWSRPALSSGLGQREKEYTFSSEPGGEHTTHCATLTHLTCHTSTSRFADTMSALFDFRAFCIVLLLAVCSCTFVKTKGARHSSPYSL